MNLVWGPQKIVVLQAPSPRPQDSRSKVQGQGSRKGRQAPEGVAVTIMHIIMRNASSLHVRCVHHRTIIIAIINRNHHRNHHRHHQSQSSSQSSSLKTKKTLDHTVSCHPKKSPRHSPSCTAAETRVDTHLVGLTKAPRTTGVRSKTCTADL